MCCFVILLLSNEMQMSVRRFSAIPHLRVDFGLLTFPAGSPFAGVGGCSASKTAFTSIRSYKSTASSPKFPCIGSWLFRHQLR